jgi:hypothetical protein
MRIKLIACEIFHRELCLAVSRSVNQVDLEFLPKGLHDIGSQGMRDRLQEAVDRVPADRYETIALGYCLCNNGIAGVTARTMPLVVPRGHDCITCFFGSRRRYQDFFDANPGTYFLTSGWLERGFATGEFSQLSIQRRSGMDQSYDELVAKYGEDNAKYLFETLTSTKNYGQYAYIAMGCEPDDRFEREARAKAAAQKWKFTKEIGDLGLIQRLVDGPWDGDFLVVPPGHRLKPSYDDGIIAEERAP